MVVQHNLTAMNSQRMLGLTMSQQAKSSEKLSSGYKINRAADDAAGLSISEKMRKQIRGLSQASLNAQDGISAVQTAEGALHEIHDMLQRMNELAVKAANGTLSEIDRSYVQDEIDQLVTEIDRVAETTKFNETYLLKGDNTVEADINFKYNETDVLSQTLVYIDNEKEVTVEAGTFIGGMRTDVTYFALGTEKKQVGATATAGNFESAKVIKVDNLYTLDDNGDYQLVRKGTKYDDTETYYNVTFTTDGTIGAAAEVTDGKTDDIVDDGWFTKGTLYNTAGAPLDSGYELGTAFTTAADNLKKYFVSKGMGVYDTTLEVTLGDVTTTKVVQFTDKDGNEIAANGLYRYFDKEGNYNGEGLFVKVGDKVDPKPASIKDTKDMVSTADKFSVGSLSMKFHVGADATTNNQISVDMMAMTGEILGVDKVRVDGLDDTNARNAIESVTAALDRVSRQRSALGAVQNRLEHTINNLDNVVENTTAAESQIRDTDMAAEMVKFSNNNILAQAGQAMLAQANQANQGVLSILG